MRQPLGLLTAGALSALTAILPAAAQQREQALLISTPPGFKVAFTHAKPDGSMRMMELVPEGQTVDAWQQMITIQHFPALQADPLELAGRWAQGFLAACPKAQASRQPQGLVNGHPAVRIYIHTPECGGRPAESVLALMIRGGDAMHTVQHAWRPRPPTREQFNAAMGNLDRARLCNAGDTACAR